MRAYWIKIVAGMLGIFAVGMLVNYGIQRARHGVDAFTHGTADIPIPLLGMVPFRLNDSVLGKIDRVVLERDTPKHVSGVIVATQLADSFDAGDYTDCFFALPRASKIDENSTFQCLDSVPAGMRVFGQVRLEAGDQTLTRPLILSEADISDFQANGNVRVHVNADSLRATTDSIVRASRQLADSIRRSVRVQVDRELQATPVPPAAPAAPKATPPSRR